MTENTPTRSSSGGVHRRTVVAGAAWTIPVVATAVGAPLAAASTTEPTLAFTNGPYTVAACGILKDVVIRATTNGPTPVAEGTPVTVTLQSGLVWSDGQSGAKVLLADSNGEVVVSAARATTGATSSVLHAATGTLATEAPVTIASSGGAYTYTPTRTFNYSGLGPVTPLGAGYWQAPNGDIYDGTSTRRVTGAQTNALGYINGAGDSVVQYVDGSGDGYIYTPTRTFNYSALGPVTPLGASYWQAPNGDIYDGTGARRATGAQTNALGYINGAGDSVLQYVVPQAC